MITRRRSRPRCRTRRHLGSVAICQLATGRITSLTLPTGLRIQDIIGPLQAIYTFDANGNRSQVNYCQYGGSGRANTHTRDFTVNAGHNKVVAVQDST